MTEQKLGRMLIVDDEVELANALCSSLKAQGYEAAAFTSGKDALRALEKQNFELLLTDLMMPDMDGVEVLQAALEIDPHLAGILMTGKGTVKTAVEAMKIGALDYVLKPFKLHSLLPVLARASEVRRLRMENVQLRETLAVFELGQTIAYSLDPNVLVHKAAEAALKQMDADEVSLMLPTDEGDELYVAAVLGKRRDELLGKRVPFGKGIAGWVAQHHEPVRLDGEVNDPRFASLHPRIDIVSAVSMPMLAGGKLIGVLNANATRRHNFTMGQVKGLNILVTTTAAALQGAMLFAHLQSAEQRYRSIFENAAEGIFQTTEDGRFILANPSLARGYGYGSPEELIEGVTDIANQLYVDPEQRAELKRQLDEQGSVAGFEVQFLRRDGAKIWIKINAGKKFDENRGLTYYEGTMEDITERKRAEDSLRDNKAFLTTLLNAIPAPVFYKDVEGRYLGCNRAFEEFFGKTRDQLIGRSVFEISPPELAEVYHAKDAELLQNPGTQIYDSQVKDANGALHDVVFHKATFMDTGGSVLGLIGVILDITERKQVEEALRESEQKYRILIDTTDTGYVIVDEEGKVIDANAEYLRLTGREFLQQILGRNVIEWTAEHDRVRNARELRMCVERGWVHNLEIDYVDGDGCFTPVEINAAVLRAADGVKILTLCRDITERKRAEQAKAEEAIRLRILFDQSRDGIAVLDQNGKVYEANRRYAEMLGYSAEEIRQLHIWDWDVQSTQEDLVERMRFKDVEGSVFETRHRRKDGTIYDVEVSSNGVELAGQKLVFCVCRDISQRKAAEQALREREHYFRSLLVNLHEDILVIDRNHQIIDSNRDFLYVIGQKREELLGRQCFDVLHGYSEPCSRHGVVCELETVFGNGHPCGCLHEHVRPDGRTVWVDMLYSLLKKEVGGPDCAILTLRDVTHEVEIEKQLRHAQKMEAIGTLAGGIAHDFNNILGIILGYAELELLESTGSDESRDRVEEIRKAALRAKDLVQQILVFSRKHGEERGPLQLGLLLKEVLKLLRAALPSTIEIRQKIDLAADNGDLISADPTQVHQVLMNLCTNAGHAMREKGGILDVSMSNVHFGPHDPARPPELPPGSYVRISVSDTGCGMDGKVMERIFEPYFTTKGVGEGTGLGLSVVHGIVRSHGGAVTVASQPGAGSTFCVFFPAGAKEVQIQPDAGPVGIPMGIERILFVDDEEELAWLGKQALEWFGYTVFSTTNSVEALDAFRAAPDEFDLVVTDQTMPQMTGMELAAELRQIRPSIPVILCTGYSELVTEQNLRAAGIQEVMMKPLVMHEVGTIIRSVLDRQGGK
jgi:two-component system, cell cycle sensor histidine kinase and response regulator CckA